MGVTSIDVTLFKKMVMNGAINLKNHQDEVNQLNVFPVPDGDTGTNMCMTITSGVNEMMNSESSSIIEAAKVLSRGALMGARGNSGVILSQFFRGVYVGLKENTTNELDKMGMLSCLASGRNIAFKAVTEPVEGTILTVIREAYETVNATIESIEDAEDLLKKYLEYAKETLAKTPEMLPVLKEAGVVDSGGAGFVKIIEGWILAIDGVILEANDAKENSSKKVESTNELKFIYDVEAVVALKKPETFEANDLVATLSLVGDALTVTRNSELVKIHVHTNKPGKVLDTCLKIGELVTTKVDNLKVKPAVKEAAEGIKEAPKKPIATIAVCFGEGIISTFREMGVDYIISGGQTMNPSTESFVEAIKEVNAENVIIIPNNGNVVMAAKQASNLVEDTNVAVIMAKTIAQGFSSLMYYDPEVDLDTNVANMEEAISGVVSGEVTYSVRDTEIGGVKINMNDYMGIADGEIIVSTKKKEDALKALLEGCIKPESHMVTFFYGNDVTKDEADGLEDLVTSINKDVDVEIIEGKQDIYSYIIAVE